MIRKKSKKWFLIEEVSAGDMFRVFLVINAICDKRSFEKKEFNVKVNNCATGLFKEKTDLIFEKEEWKKNGKYLVKLIEKQKSSFFKEVNRGISESTVELNSYIDKKIFNAKKLSYKEAMSIYRKTFSLLTNIYNWAFIYELLELGEEKLLTAYLKDILRKKTKENINDYFNILTQSTKESWIEKEKIEFLKLISGKHTNDLVDNHFRRFFWIPSFGSFAIWNKEHFFKKIKDFKGTPREILKEIKKEKNEIKNEIEKTEKELSLTKEERDIFSEVRELAYGKDYRRGVQNKLFLAIYRNILPVIEKELEIKREDLKWLTLEELEKKWFDEKEIKKRKKGCVFIIEDGKKAKIITGNPKSILDYEKIRSNAGNKIKGTVAYKGEKSLLKGKVKIILNRKDIKKIQKGDILVSYMTNPDLIEAIYKAKAIITDMGGITCHASIVARELKKPCIIGTKIATKVLKDGDLVEVDANKGIVKILKKNSE